MAYSSRSLVTMILVSLAPSSSSCRRTRWASSSRSPESIRTAPRPGPATSTASATASVTSKVSTSSVVPPPRESTCAVKASRSLSCSRVKACALVPTVGMLYRNPAARSEVELKPPTKAAREAATAASSWVCLLYT